MDLIKSSRCLELNSDRPRYNNKKTKNIIPLQGMFKALSNVYIEAQTELDSNGYHVY